MLKRFLLPIFLFACQLNAHAVEGKLSTADQAQIVATAERFFALSYPEATCAFSKVDNNGKYVDSRVYNVKFREAGYEKTFKPLLSADLYGRLRPLCLKRDQWGMLDFRANDDGLASEPEVANDVVLKLTRPVQVEPRSTDKATAKVYWSELSNKHSKTIYAFGRTDLVLVKEKGAWLIDDAYIATFASGESPDSGRTKEILNNSTAEFEKDKDNISVIHFRGLPLSCADGAACK